LASCETVILGKRSEEWFGEDGEGLKFVAADGESEDGEVDGGGAETFEEHGSDFLDDRDLCLRKFAGESHEMGRQEVRRDGGNDADSDGAATGIFLIGEIAAGGFEFTENGACPGKEGFARFREADRATEPIEEACAELVFELADLLGERGLGDMSKASGAAEAAGIDDGAEVAELVEFHGAKKVLSYKS
jgi:hypothetical protein